MIAVRPVLSALLCVVATGCGAAPGPVHAAGPPRRAAVALERALRATPNAGVAGASCRRATPAERRDAPFRATRRPVFTCRVGIGQGLAEPFAVQVLANGCFVAERHRPGRAIYGCEPTAVDLGDGLSARLPVGWSRTPSPVTDLGAPVDRLLLTSFPARPGGSCAPTKAARAMPPDGALIFLIEFVTRRGEPTIRLAGVPRGARLRLTRPSLLECWGIPASTTIFQDSGRAFQLFVAFGRRASAARHQEVRRIVDGLRVAPLN